MTRALEAEQDSPGPPVRNPVRRDCPLPPTVPPVCWVLDVAPDRKQDPGEYFDWEGLAANGVGLWPTEPVLPAPPAERALALLAAIGYRNDIALPVLLTAFQRRWRQTRVDGEADAETMAVLAAVSKLHADPASHPH